MMKGFLMKEQDVYTIGEASIVTGLSKQTLRYYDSIKLVEPAIRKPDNNYRQYTREQIILLCTVKRLRSMECSIEEIREILEADDIATLLEKVKVRTEFLKDDIIKKQRIVDENTEFISRLQVAAQIYDHKLMGIDNMDDYLFTNMSTEEIPQTVIYSIRRLMPDYNINDTSINFWSELLDKCEADGFNSTGYAMAIYHNEMLGQFIMKDCDLELGIRISDCAHTPDADNPNVRVYGGFNAATAIHVGDYATLINTYILLLQWINRNGYEACGEASEEFIISPHESYNQKRLIIKLIIPVNQRRA